MQPRAIAAAGLAVGVLATLIAWPFLGSGSRAVAARPTPAAVLPDYLYRNKTIAFYETRIKRDPQDQISARTLAQQYMQRYRESGDIGDILRASAQARRSIRLQPGNNAAAYQILASAQTALHLFRPALANEKFAAGDRPGDPNTQAQIASLEMELGQYPAARVQIVRALASHPNDSGLLSVSARYDELTGDLADARRLLDRGQVIIDSVIDNSAQSRAWFHFRAGEMAFSAGALDEAKQDERDAIAIFPNFAQAYNALARFCWGSKDWPCALDAATKGAAIVPLPETLGYKADAERALGQDAQAAQTQDLIFTIERLGNAYHVSDRLLAVYYSDHRIRLDDALRIARREIALRGNEIYAQDTLAWAAAMDGHWLEAQQASRRAMSYGIEDPRVRYHAGIIAMHFGHRSEARSDFESALRLNPAFHPVYADDARAALRGL